MNARAKAVQKRDHFTFYMDLLGHDVLNNNQAVLSYLELISAKPGTDKNVKTLAEKAISHVRTSTILVDNVKKLIAARNIQLDKLRPVDLAKSIDKAEAGLRKHFPDKRIRIERADLPKGASVLGNSYADDLILNILVTAVRLSSDDDIAILVRGTPGEVGKIPAWVVKVEIGNARLPPFLDSEGISSAYSRDISTAVGMTGLLFAKMLADSLGGDFEAHSIKKDRNKAGAVFTLSLRRSG